MTDRPHAIRFVIFHDEEALVAVCLEHYIVAQGRTVEELHQRLKTVYRAELDDTLERTDIPFNGIAPAPEQYHRMWEENGGGVMRGTIFAKATEDVGPEDVKLAA